ncbi:MAG: hypothetical protein JO353_04645 [Phycisphaerae bacterium]|nr:hypothetical protein [Phycisphaerae bacterium]
MLFFTIPGICSARMLGLWSSRQSLLGRLMPAPALGLILYGPLAFVCFTIFNFSLITIATTWIMFIVATLAMAKWRPFSGSLLSPNISNNSAILLLIFAGAWALLPASENYPYRGYGGLYTNDPLYDHVKVAFTDAIVREGMPLKNPFYAPAGERIALSYSYGWYIPSAIVKRLTHADGWESEIANSWSTSFSIIAFLAALACALSGGSAAGFWLIAVAAVGPLAPDLLPRLCGHYLAPLVALYPGNHGLEVPWLQLAWAPQHVFSALAIVVMLWMTSAVLADAAWRKRFIVAIGFAAAGAFESSSWVGGIAIVAATPVLVVAAASLRLGRQRIITFLKTVVPAVILCALLILPLLLVLTHGTAQSEQPRTMGFGIFETTDLEAHLGLHGTAQMVARIILYWIHFLPLSFGAIYIVGLPMMFLFRPQTPGERAFRAVAIGGMIGFLLVSQFLKSTIRANDLGWRAVNVSTMLLCTFAAIGLSQFRIRPILGPLGIASLALGLLATVTVANVPIPLTRPPEDVIALHRAYARQYEAWKAVRRYTKPTDLVQENPEGFADLPPWAIELPYHLFADRSAAYSCDGTARTYAFRYSWDENRRTGRMIASIFSNDPRVKYIKELRWTFNVKALLVTVRDPVWKSTVIEDSGVYRIVAHNDEYKVYIATVGR